MKNIKNLKLKDWLLLFIFVIITTLVIYITIINCYQVGFLKDTIKYQEFIYNGAIGEKGELLKILNQYKQLLSNIYLTLSIVFVLYLVTIPITILYFIKKLKTTKTN